MEYYARPEGTERALRSRIRRCFQAIQELQSLVTSVNAHTDLLTDDYHDLHESDLSDPYQCAYLTLTGLTPDRIDAPVTYDRVERRLLAVPELAEKVSTEINRIHDTTEALIRNLHYQADAGLIDVEEEQVKSLRLDAIRILGLTDVILDAIDQGFITDASLYNETRN